MIQAYKHLIKSFKNIIKPMIDNKYASYFLFILSSIESVFFPIPPDFLLIALCLKNKHKAFFYAFICSLGSLFGALIGYLIGHYLWWDEGTYSKLALFFFNYLPGFTENIFESIRLKYEQYNFIIILTAGFTPIPFKIFTIISGVIGISIYQFILAVIISRFSRFYLISFLLLLYGKSIKMILDKYFNHLGIATIIIVIIYFLLK